MASTITQRVQLACTDSFGDTVQGMLSQTAAQSGGKDFSAIQTVATINTLVNFGDLTGAKYFFARNNDLANTVYIDIANPATTGAPIKLLPGQCMMIATSKDVFHAIAITGNCECQFVVVAQ
jgi:hypothetical protein